MAVTVVTCKFLAIFFGCIWLGSFGTMLAMQPPTNPTESADSRFENMKVLGDVPADQIGKLMNLMSYGLGVSCNHCHPGLRFAAEGVASKDKAREMLELTRDINRRYFAGKPAVSCYTCHVGQLTPVAWPNGPNRRFDPLETQAPGIATDTAAVLRSYVENNSTDRVDEEPRPWLLQGERIEPNGRREPEAEWIEPQGLSHLATRYPSANGTIDVEQGFREGVPWKRVGGRTIPLKQEEALLIDWDRWFVRPKKLAMALEHSVSAGFEPIDDALCDKLVLQERDSIELHFWFDRATSRLRRRTCVVPTELGPYRIQVDYRDYRKVDECWIAWEVEWTMPGMGWKRQIQQVRRDREIQPNDLFER